MKQSIKILLIVIFSIFLIPISKSILSAQNVEKQRGRKGNICKEQILSKFIKGEFVDDYVLRGNDIIEITKETNHQIQISNSIIEGGLDFTKLPTLTLEKIELPTNWIEKQKEVFFKTKSPILKNIHIVQNRIVIVDSEIRSKDGDFSINAEGAFFYEAIDFDGATFSGGAHFGEATFSDYADLCEATFSGEADFSYATFSVHVHFSDTTFNDKADFVNATFRKLAYFKEAVFHNTLIFRFSKFEEYADFRDSRIRKLDFNNVESPITLEGRIDFRRAIISEAHFEDIIFEKDLDLSDVHFCIPLATSENVKNLAVVFRYVTFESNAYFIRTAFNGNTAFERVNFKKDANFTGANFMHKKNDDKHKFFSLSYISVENLLIKLDQFPNPESWVSASNDRIKSFIDSAKEKKKDEKKSKGIEKAGSREGARLEALSEVLKGLEANFRKHNQLADANSAFYYRKRAELKEPRNKEVSWSSFQKKLEWFFWGIPCGYGTKIWWIIGWSFFFNVVFATIYSVKASLKRESPPKRKTEFIFKQRLFDLPKEYLTLSSSHEIKYKSIRKFINALRFSSVVLFKIGYRDTTVARLQKGFGPSVVHRGGDTFTPAQHAYRYLSPQALHNNPDLLLCAEFSPCCSPDLLNHIRRSHIQPPFSSRPDLGTSVLMSTYNLFSHHKVCHFR